MECNCGEVFSLTVPSSKGTNGKNTAWKNTDRKCTNRENTCRKKGTNRKNPYRKGASRSSSKGTSSKTMEDIVKNSSTKKIHVRAMSRQLLPILQFEFWLVRNLCRRDTHPMPFVVVVQVLAFSKRLDSCDVHGAKVMLQEVVGLPARSL